MQKKIIAGVTAGLFITGIVSGCGTQPNPTGAVQGFLTAVQQEDVTKATTYVTGAKGDLFDLQTGASQMTKEQTDTVIKAVFSEYKFENPTLVSTIGDTSTVSVQITSKDIGTVAMETISELMPVMMAQAFSDSGSTDSAAQEKMIVDKLVKNLNSTDVAMSTRKETLTVKKKADGTYKILDNKNLTDAIMAGANDLNNAFGNN